jgi:hypothetical protein
MKTLQHRLFLALAVLVPAAACSSDGEERQLDFPQLDACGASIDVENDGTVEGRWSYFYDDRGFDVRDELDSDLDGKIDEKYVSTYDDDGNFLTFQFFALDDSGELVLGFAMNATYEKGRQVGTETDSEGDGSIDTRTTYVHEGDRLVEARTDSQADGDVDSVITYHYDADGRQSHRDSDLDLDGEPDEITTLTYGSEDERWILSETQVVATGEVRRRTSREFGADGYVSRQTMMLRPDWIIDTRYTYVDGKLATAEETTTSDGVELVTLTTYLSSCGGTEPTGAKPSPRARVAGMRLGLDRIDE